MAIVGRSLAETQRGESFLRLARGVGALLHETQRERGVSAVHVKSGRRLFAAELDAQRARTDARRRAVSSLVESIGTELLANPEARLERLAEAGAAVAGIREDMGAGRATPARVVDTFCRLNVELLSALDAGAARLGEGEVRCLALAALALQNAKEKTGLERARLGAAFVGAGPDDDDRVALAELVAARASYLHVYGITAPAPAAQMLKRVLAAPPALEVKRIEERVMAAGAPAVEINAWFQTISRTIEMMGDVGNATLSYFPYA